MNLNQSEMNEWLLGLRYAVDGDFAALAFRSGDGRQYRWMYTSGSLSGRCEAMSFRAGQGLGGQSLRIGRSVIWNPAAPETQRLRGECPLMQAEDLRSAITVPVVIDGQGYGVLAVGSRKDRLFGRGDADLVERQGERLGKGMGQPFK